MSKKTAVSDFVVVHSLDVGASKFHDLMRDLVRDFLEKFAYSICKTAKSVVNLSLILKYPNFE